jgi:hypothetical protein
MFRSFFANWPLLILVFGMVMNVALIGAVFWGLGHLIGVL